MHDTEYSLIRKIFSRCSASVYKTTNKQNTFKKRLYHPFFFKNCPKYFSCRLFVLLILNSRFFLAFLTTYPTWQEHLEFLMDRQPFTKVFLTQL